MFGNTYLKSTELILETGNKWLSMQQLKNKAGSAATRCK